MIYTIKKSNDNDLYDTLYHNSAIPFKWLWGWRVVNDNGTTYQFTIDNCSMCADLFEQIERLYNHRHPNINH